MILTVALAMGLLGAVLAIFLQYFAVGFAGFLAGVRLITVFSCSFEYGKQHLPLAIRPDWRSHCRYLGVDAAGLAVVTILSSLVGASLVCQALQLQQGMAVLVFVVLAAVGILIQSKVDRRRATTAYISNTHPSTHENTG